VGSHCSPQVELQVNTQVSAAVIRTYILKPLFSHLPILDLRYWTLLANILSDAASSTASWISSLLGRIPFVAITTTLLRSGTQQSDQIDRLATNFQAVFTVCWPIAVKRCNLDTLADCFYASIEFAASSTQSTIHGSFQTALCSVLQAFQHAVSESTTIKKVRFSS
jgi:hypothetical protein